MKENVSIVNASGQMTGTMEKMAAHKKGLLHRALSVFIFNKQGQLLLQQRALCKYHSGGLWTNTCCSHPRLGENTLSAAHRRLGEEMGISCELTELFQFTYRHVFDNGLTEHEYDHVFVGISDQLPDPDPDEVAAYQYTEPDVIITDVANNPEKYTAWFKLIFERVLKNSQYIIS